MKKYIVILSVFILSSCGSNKYQDYAKENEIEFIAEIDSIKVYRIIYHGNPLYITNKGAISN